MPDPCPSLEALEQLASGGSIDNAVIDHAQNCASCQGRVREIRQNLALLPDLAMLQTPSPTWTGPEHSIEGYDIHDTIARGSQGVVYRATQRATKRPVAIKVLLGGKFATQRQRIRFEREVELAAALRHPNIVTYFDSGTTVDGRRFCVMELVNGRSLGDRLDTLAAANRRPSQRDLLNVFVKICSAVAYAHQRGVIHRDLKPANILIDAAGEPRVVDFGLARNLEAIAHVHEPTVTHPGEFAGTFAYASPEQTMGGGEVDVRSDVYSLGVILFEMLTAKLPYKTSGPLSGVIRAICEQQPLPPSQHRPEVHYEIETILFKALSKAPERRYQSVAALMRDIEHHLKGEPIDAKRDSRWYVIRKTVHRHRYVASAALLAVVMLTGFSILMAIAYRRASSAEAIAAARSIELADSLSRSNIERGRVLAAAGNVALAEEMLWREHLAAADRDSDLSPTLWALRELYLRNPGVAAVMLPAEEWGDNIWTISRDGSKLIVGEATDRSTHILETATGHSIATTSEILRGSTFSFDGNRVFAALPDGTIGVIDAASGAIAQRSVPLGTSVLRVSASPTNDRLAIITPSGQITLLEMPAMDQPRPMPLRDDPARMVCFTSDGRRFAVGTLGGAVEIWSVDGTLLSRSPRDTSNRVAHAICAMAFSPDDARLVAALDRGDADLWNASDLSAPIIRSIDRDAVMLAFSPDGKWLATGGNDRLLRLRNLSTGEVRAFGGHTGPIRLMGFSSDGTRLTTIAKNGSIRAWDLAPIVIHHPRHENSILSTARSESADIVATGSADESVIVTDSVFNAVQRFDVGSVVHTIAISRDNLLAAGARDGTVHLWKLGRQLAGGERELLDQRILWIDDSPINAIAFSPDGSRLAAASYKQALTICDLTASEPKIAPFAADNDLLSWVAFSPDGSLIAAGGKRTHAVRVWDAKTGIERFALRGHTDVVRCVAFSPDGRWIASGSDDQTIRLWSAADGQCVAVLEGHQRAVFGLAFRHDGRVLASSGGDVRLWSVPERRLLASFEVSHEIQLGVDLTADGRTLLTWGTSPDLTRLDLFRADAFVEGNRAYWEERVGK